jgi:hypothetical protein
VVFTVRSTPVATESSWFRHIPACKESTVFVQFGDFSICVPNIVQVSSLIFYFNFFLQIIHILILFPIYDTVLLLFVFLMLFLIYNTYSLIYETVGNF